MGGLLTITRVVPVALAMLCASAAIAEPSAAEPQAGGTPTPAAQVATGEAAAPAAGAGAPRGDAGRALGPRTPTSAPGAGAAPAEPSTIMSMLVPLGVVLGVIIACAAIFKRVVVGNGSIAAAFGAGGRAPSGVLEVLGRFPIARGQTLVLLKLDRRVLLVGHCAPTRGGSGGFQTICELADPEDVASILMKVNEGSGDSLSAKFNELLNQQQDLGIEDMTRRSRGANLDTDDEMSATSFDPRARGGIAARVDVLKAHLSGKSRGRA